MERVLALGQDMALLWIRYAPLYLSGVVNTLLLAVAATVLGCLIGLACGLLNTIPIHPQDRLPRRVLLWLLRAVIRIYVEVFRGTPMVLQAVFLYYGLPYFTNNAMRFDNVWAAALLVVSINTGAYMAESVRGGILSVDPGQTEGAQSYRHEPRTDHGEPSSSPLGPAQYHAPRSAITSSSTSRTPR